MLVQNAFINSHKVKGHGIFKMRLGSMNILNSKWNQFAQNRKKIVHANWNLNVTRTNHYSPTFINTHHSPNLGEIIVLFPIIYFMISNRDYICSCQS
jgi:hypothetical protein